MLKKAQHWVGCIRTPELHWSDRRVAPRSSIPWDCRLYSGQWNGRLDRHDRVPDCAIFTLGERNQR